VTFLEKVYMTVYENASKKYHEIKEALEVLRL